MSAQVYVMKQGNLVKVGFSGNPERRKSTLSASIGSISVERCFGVTKHRAVEAKAHMLLADRRAHGEWFFASVEEAVSAIEAAIQLVNAEYVAVPLSGGTAVSFRLDEETLELLERLADRHGGKAAAVRAGLLALERRNELTREELLAEIARRIT